MTSLPPDLFPRVTQLLLPPMGTEDERDAWLTQAFFKLDGGSLTISSAGANLKVWEW